MIILIIIKGANKKRKRIGKIKNVDYPPPPPCFTMNHLLFITTLYSII